MTVGTDSYRKECVVFGVAFGFQKEKDQSDERALRNVNIEHSSVCSSAPTPEKDKRTCIFRVLHDSSRPILLTSQNAHPSSLLQSYKTISGNVHLISCAYYVLLITSVLRLKQCLENHFSP